MNCDAIRQQLSAFHDGELPSDEAERVQQHLATCAECRHSLEAIQRLGRITHALVASEPERDLWPQIVADLNGPPTAAQASSAGHWLWRWWGVGIALAVVALIGVGVVSWRHQGGITENERLAGIFDRYLQEFLVSPHEAQRFLDHAFPSKPVAQSDAGTVAGTSMVALRKSLPGLTRVAMHVRKMPCCDCVQGLYQRGDGSCIAVFEHEMPAQWDSRDSSREVQCGNCVCRLRQLDDRVAASWEHDARYFTVIGVKDVEELSQIVQALDPSEADKSEPTSSTTES